ncbi:uncharacterized protein LOC121926823 isoform X2 [Sceloporus undulatus]|uniref:uncharacterized protein LOC121926823 isoform X2 n=1 Tax=Sceloporus undulatus TaxID=8520 RepID=UPI001C4D4CE8|nr:uncharacterized protein LOC121926823 isoform X2 [Sceloporus undulatus]
MARWPPARSLPRSPAPSFLQRPARLRRPSRASAHARNTGEKMGDEKAVGAEKKEEEEEGRKEGARAGRRTASAAAENPSAARRRRRCSWSTYSTDVGFLLSLKTEQRKKRSYNFKTELAMEVIMDLHIHFRFTVVCADIFV